MNKSIVVLLFSLSVLAQDFQKGNAPLVRRYREGETQTYRMKGTNENWRYEVQASGVVTKDASGKFREEYEWSKFFSDGKEIPLSAASQQFRQVLTLGLETPPAMPNLAAVQPNLIGPITDLMTFYVDLWLANRTGKLMQAGDHVYQKLGIPASWADGNYVVLGEDSIDFDMTLTDVDRSNGLAKLLVRHVPPQDPTVHLPAAWMREPVADTKNNWVNVAKRGGKFIAEVGKETFDVRMKVSLADGRILSGAIENPVKAKQRECEDAALALCGDAKPHDIMRRIEIALEQ